MTPGVVIQVRPPDVVGPLRLGATDEETLETLRRLGEPVFLCGFQGGRPGWGVDRPSGVSLYCHFDATDRVEAIQLGSPDRADAVIYDGLDLFRTPADEVVAALRARTAVTGDENGHTYHAPGLFLSLWRPVTPEELGNEDEDWDGRFFATALVALPGYRRLYCATGMPHSI
ncbi:hypothetical protein DMA12_05975 [Amycolatopsis balhimycina DSM 5908]|uniref:Uncharacterized protein n=1 Tax=Amycolatopsis balhimycina DSM 5908 TaxID=1081091 RepID=A0A428X004_AMYBA|nr:hypothetical protein [Amycolatopsis balhimycina]RSM48672.1 hypothetical protein DMA12_05975 [Amycolatopsis balhimycina DSM 5908]